MEFKIAILKGDGIGPEVIDVSLKVLDKVGNLFDHAFKYKQGYLGGESIDKFGEPLTKETIDICQSSDAVILGAVGGSKWDMLPPSKRPEKGILDIRKALGLYVNLRPAIIYPSLKNSSPLKNRIIKNGVDILVVRELTGGIYFGERSFSEEAAYDTLKYTALEVERITKKAFEIAKTRNKKVTSVDKSNVLASSKLWKKSVLKVSRYYPEVELNHLYVDNAAMQLIINPKQFDVILTGNMFGDILSDEISTITGSIGMLPSASIGNGKIGIYEPIHGSAPDIADRNIANPLATILSISMMLKHSLNLPKEALAINNAVKKVLNSGYRTIDIYSKGCKKIGTKEMGNLVIEELQKIN